MDFDQIMRQVQDTLTVVVGIQERQARVQKLQAEELDALRAMLVEGLRLHEQRMARFDEKMLEIEEKLNALIQVVDGMQKRDRKE